MAKPLTALSASLLAAIMHAGCASLPFEDESLNSATGPRTLEARRLEPGIVRNSSPAQQAIGVTGVGVPVVAGMPAPIAAEVYGPVFAEARKADWSNVGIEPVRYVEDRLNKEAFLMPLLNNQQVQVVLHRQAIKISQVPSVNPSHTRNVSHPDAKDFPGRVYWSPDDRAYHLVAIPGEDWFRQTLHMLATAGVAAEKIYVEGVFVPEALVAADLDPTLAVHEFDSVTICPMGELGRAIERVLRKRERPAYAEKILANIVTFLEERIREAPPDKKPRWEERLHRLEELRHQGGPALEQIARIKADQVLSGPLTEFIRAAEEGPPHQELPWRFSIKNADVFTHRILEVDGKKHLMIHIGGAHGDMAYHAVRYVLAKKPILGRVNVYGSAGSLSITIPPDTFILPSETIRSLEEDRSNVSVDNRAVLDGAVLVRHSNVSTLLREHRAGLERMAALPADTVDIESYHVARAVSEAGRSIDFRAILRVSDVATSSELGAHREARAQTSNYDRRRVDEERVVSALGFLAGNE